ncbi:MAG: RNA methyltransferase [Treponema sp.]|jgi:TrmH RNA methyltransferase|nr:RNA methyltransferase [Treponema sp.]
MDTTLTKELAVCGFNAVSALGELHPARINRLFLRADRLPLFTKVCKHLAVRKRPYKLCGDEELERICKSNRHQGVVAMIEEPLVAYASPEDLDLWAQEGKTGLILHAVGNDHNLGTMVRAAAFFNAPFIVISEADTEAHLTTTAYRVAEGGMEQVVFRKIRDTVAFIKAASDAIITIGMEPRARLRIRDLGTILRDRGDTLQSGMSRHYIVRHNIFPSIALVVGNEETGLPQEVKACCSALVRIPGTGAIESLSTAQAVTLFLHEIYEL